MNGEWKHAPDKTEVLLSLEDVTQKPDDASCISCLCQRQNGTGQGVLPVGTVTLAAMTERGEEAESERENERKKGGQ